MFPAIASNKTIWYPIKTLKRIAFYGIKFFYFIIFGKRMNESIYLKYKPVLFVNCLEISTDVILVIICFNWKQFICYEIVIDIVKDKHV